MSNNRIFHKINIDFLSAYNKLKTKLRLLNFNQLLSYEINYDILAGLTHCLRTEEYSDVSVDESTLQFFNTCGS